MTKKIISIAIAAFICAAAFASSAKAEPIGLDVGLQYNSDYFWRGFTFYGTNAPDETRAVFFPWVGYAFSDFYLYVGGEVAEGLIADDANSYENDWNGVDFILTWSKPVLDDAIKLGMKLSYFWYPRSRSDEYFSDGKANDFAEVAPSITLSKLPLSPKLLVSWYYRIEEQTDGQETAKDLYTNLSLGHSFTMVESASLYLGAWGGYFYYASQEIDGDPRQGFSDVGVMAKITVKAPGGVSVNASYNYAYTPDEDFYRFTNTGKADKHHHWTSFGVSYSL